MILWYDTILNMILWIIHIARWFIIVWRKWDENNNIYEKKYHIFQNRTSLWQVMAETSIDFIYNISRISFCIYFKSHFQIPKPNIIWSSRNMVIFKPNGNLKAISRALKIKLFAPIPRETTLFRSACISNVSFVIPAF